MVSRIGLVWLIVGVALAGGLPERAAAQARRRAPEDVAAFLRRALHL